MRLIKHFFTDRGWQQTRVRNFTRCAESADQVRVISEHDDGFCTEVELLIQAPYSLTDEFAQMLQRDRVVISDLVVEKASTTLMIQIY